MLFRSWTLAHQAFLSFTISWSLPKLMSIGSVMPSNHLISVVPFSSCLQSSPASGSFPVSQLFLDERKSHELYSLIPSPTSDRPVMSWNDSWEQAMLESWLEEHIAPRFARVICRICVVRVESELFKIYFFFFWSCCAAYSILVLKQGSNSCLLHSKGGVLTVGPPGKSPRV